MLLAPSGIFENLPGMSGKCRGILFWWLGGNSEDAVSVSNELWDVTVRHYTWALEGYIRVHCIVISWCVEICRISRFRGQGLLCRCEPYVFFLGHHFCHSGQHRIRDMQGVHDVSLVVQNGNCKGNIGNIAESLVQWIWKSRADQPSKNWEIWDVK